MRGISPHQSCGADSRPVILRVTMLTKELTTRPAYRSGSSSRCTPRQSASYPPVRSGPLRPSSTAIAASPPKQGNKIELWSRRGNSFKLRWPEIARAFEKLPANTLIDGEVVAIGADGKVSFNALQHSRNGAHLQFYAFDLLVDRGESTLRLPLEKRRERLGAALVKVEYPVIQSSPFDAKPADLIRAAHELSRMGTLASLNTFDTAPA